MHYNADMARRARNGLLLITGVATAIFAFYLVFSLVEAYDFPQFRNETMPAVAITALEQVSFVHTENRKHEYIEVTESCGPYFESACVNIRSGPGEHYPVITTIRKGAVLKVSGKITSGERDWYKITFDEWIRYPERVRGNWYIASDFVKPFYNEGVIELSDRRNTQTEKRILIDRSSQKLYAYDGEALFMEQSISTGIELTPTPRGTFTIFKKTPSRYMQGPLPGIISKYYDLPGVPWNLYFTHQGAVIHGAYWHDKFGQPWSSGCVNVDTEKAEALYHWADVGTKVTVRD